MKRPEQPAHLRKIIRRITVTRHRVHIAFSPVGLTATLMRSNDYRAPQQSLVEDEHTISVPVSLRRCGIETRLVVPNGDTAPAHHASTRAIQEALAKALTWNDELMSGKVSSMNQLAKREGVTQRYIAHLLKLAYLAPDIMQAIARGDIPSAVSLGRLKKGFPLDWQEQRKVLGFSA